MVNLTITFVLSPVFLAGRPLNDPKPDGAPNDVHSGISANKKHKNQTPMNTNMI